jgi:hypothetical protein
MAVPAVLPDIGGGACEKERPDGTPQRCRRTRLTCPPTRTTVRSAALHK